MENLVIHQETKKLDNAYKYILDELMAWIQNKQKIKKFLEENMCNIKLGKDILRQ